MTKEEFEKARKEIENINSELTELFEKRFELAEKIGKYKIQNSLLTEDKEREKYLLSRVPQSEYRLYIQNIFREIFVQSKNMQNNIKYSIIFVGMPGVGKTTLAGKLAEKYSIPFADTDKIICEKENLTVSEIFEKYGEDYFRDRETETVFSLKKNCIIATGGGTLSRKENAEFLKKLGFIVYLKTDPRILAKRIIPGRPLVKSENDIYELFRKRDPIFTKYADITIEINDCENLNFINTEKKVLKISKELKL